MEAELVRLVGCYKSPVSESNCIYYLEGYLEVYKYKFKNSEYGYSIVDKTCGIYPLVCYPYPNSFFQGEPAKERAKAFHAVIDDVAQNKKDEVKLAFKKHKNWNDLQAELQMLFHKVANQKAA